MITPPYFWTYVGLGVWAVAEYLAWSPKLPQFKPHRHKAIIIYILAFVFSAITAIHGW